MAEEGTGSCYGDLDNGADKLLGSMKGMKDRQDRMEVDLEALKKEIANMKMDLPLHVPRFVDILNAGVN